METDHVIEELVAALDMDDMNSVPTSEAHRAPANDEADATTELTTDSVQSYMVEIGRVPLLSAAKEVELAARIERGAAAQRRLAQAEPRTQALQQALEADLEDGLEAREHLIRANLRLVVSIAKRFRGHGLSFMELIQEGNIGLMRAVEKFDASRGNRFSTYATWWIRQAVSRALAQHSRTIRLPVHLSESVVRIKRTAEQLAQTLGRQPRADEIANDLGVAVEKIELVLDAMRGTISLETPVGEDGDSTLGDLIENKNNATPMELAVERMMRRDVASALDELSVRERRILALRYGIDDGHARTLEEVGREMGMTRERARQIERDALRRLRGSARGQQLQDYLA